MGLVTPLQDPPWTVLFFGKLITARKHTKTNARTIYQSLVPEIRPNISSIHAFNTLFFLTLKTRIKKRNENCVFRLRDESVTKRRSRDISRGLLWVNEVGKCVPNIVVTKPRKNASAFVCVAALLHVKIYVLFYTLVLAWVDSSSRCKEDKNFW